MKEKHSSNRTGRASADLTPKKTSARNEKFDCSANQLHFDREGNKNQPVFESVTKIYPPTVDVQCRTHGSIEVDSTLHDTSSHSNRKVLPSSFHMYARTDNLKEKGNLYTNDHSNFIDQPPYGINKQLQRQSISYFVRSETTHMNNEMNGSIGDSINDHRTSQAASLVRFGTGTGTGTGTQSTRRIPQEANPKPSAEYGHLRKASIPKDDLPNYSYVYDRKGKVNMSSNNAPSKKGRPVSTQIAIGVQTAPITKRSRITKPNGMDFYNLTAAQRIDRSEFGHSALSSPTRLSLSHNENSNKLNTQFNKGNIHCTDKNKSEFDDKAMYNRREHHIPPFGNRKFSSPRISINGEKGCRSNHTMAKMSTTGQSLTSNVGENVSFFTSKTSEKSNKDTTQFASEVKSIITPNLQNYATALEDIELRTGSKSISQSKCVNAENHLNNSSLNEYDEMTRTTEASHGNLNSKTIETKRTCKGLVFPIDLENILSLAGSIVASEIRSGKWTTIPENLEKHKVGIFDKDMYLHSAASAVEKFVPEVILPSFMSAATCEDNGSEKREQSAYEYGRILVAALLSLREVLATNSELVFCLKNDPKVFNDHSSSKIDIDAIETVPGDSRREQLRKNEDHAFQSQLLSTALILSAIDKLPSEISSSTSEKFLESIRKYDSADEEFVSCLDRADGCSNCVLPTGQALGKEENIAWQVSFNRCRDNHHLIKGRERKNALYHHFVSESVKEQVTGKESTLLKHVNPYQRVAIPAPNVCATYVVEAIPFENMKKTQAKTDLIQRLKRERLAILKHRHILRRLRIKRIRNSR